MRRRLAVAVLAVLALVPTLPAFAQGPVTVTGVVTTREDGLPLPGATVSIESLNVSATTDAEGRYRLEVPASAAGQAADLKASFSGLNPRVVPIRLTGSVTHDFALGLGFHEEITVGSRAMGAEAEKAVPVDIITARQIETTGLSETMQVIQKLAPSFNFPRPTITDGTDSVRPATLRGLGPDQVLVLINGKRRHTSALVHLNGCIGRGSTGVDLNAIPVSAIERIEVLRDGAAAQYGSDAIAGVINIVMKSGAGPLTAAPSRAAPPRTRTASCSTAGANYGFGIGRGALNVDRGVPGPQRDQPRRRRPARPDPRRRRRQQRRAAAEPPLGRLRLAGPHGLRRTSTCPVGTSETTFFYGFGGWSNREGRTAGSIAAASTRGTGPRSTRSASCPSSSPASSTRPPPSASAARSRSGSGTRRPSTATTASSST